MGIQLEVDLLTKPYFCSLLLEKHFSLNLLQIYYTKDFTSISCVICHWFLINPTTNLIFYLLVIYLHYLSFYLLAASIYHSHASIPLFSYNCLRFKSIIKPFGFYWLWSHRSSHHNTQRMILYSLINIIKAFFFLSSQKKKSLLIS